MMAACAMIGPGACVTVITMMTSMQVDAMQARPEAAADDAETMLEQDTVNACMACPRPVGWWY